LIVYTMAYVGGGIGRTYGGGDTGRTGSIPLSRLNIADPIIYMIKRNIPPHTVDITITNIFIAFVI
jgi:hypothetical protein